MRSQPLSQPELARKGRDLGGRKAICYLRLLKALFTWTAQWLGSLDFFICISLNEHRPKNNFYISFSSLALNFLNSATWSDPLTP